MQRSQWPTLLTLALAGLTSLAACASEDSTPQGPTREVLPNGATLVRHTGFAPTPIVVAPDLSIGSVESSAGHDVFGDVRGIEADPEGNIYVLDQQTSEIRVFDDDGNWTRTITRQGEGPGEISQANGIRFGPDGVLWAQDHRRWTFLGLDTRGNEVRRHPMHLLNYSYTWVGGIDEQGRMWKRTSISDEERVYPPPVGLNESTYEMIWVSLDLETEAVDTVSIGRYDTRTWVAELANGFRYSGIPFEGRLQTVVDPTGRGAWVSHPNRYALVRFDAEGDSALVVETDLPAPPVTQALIDEWMETMSEDADGRRIAAQLRPLIPEVRAQLANITVDGSGRLWVLRNRLAEDAPAHIDVFGPEGDHLATLAVDHPVQPYFEPVVRGDHLYMLSTDELDVQSVVRFPLPAALR